MIVYYLPQKKPDKRGLNMDVKEKAKMDLLDIVNDLQGSEEVKFSVIVGMFYTLLENEDEDRIHNALMDEFWEYNQRDTGERILGKTNKN